MTRLHVRDLMTRRVYTAGLSDSLATVFDLMDSVGIRHVPILDRSGTFVGLVSARDLNLNQGNAYRLLPLSEVRQLLETRSVGEILIEDPPTIGPDEEIDDAGRIMLENKLGCLPVLEGDRLAGILTEADFVRYLIEHPEIQSPPTNRAA